MVVTPPLLGAFVLPHAASTTTDATAPNNLRLNKCMGHSS